MSDLMWVGGSAVIAGIAIAASYSTTGDIVAGLGIAAIGAVLILRDAYR